MSRRKQAKPQHINSEEDQGEQQPQQQAAEFADAAPAAGEPGEWGRGRTPGARSFPHVRGLRGASGFQRTLWDRDLGLSSREEGQPHPPPPPLLILFLSFPSLL